jgi:Flp pilus assembly pilin Flp
MNALKRMLHNASGVTIVEYAVMLAFVALVSIALIAALGSNTSGLFAPLYSEWSSL